jgi:hypothetical protein
MGIMEGLVLLVPHCLQLLGEVEEEHGVMLVGLLQGPVEAVLEAGEDVFQLLRHVHQLMELIIHQYYLQAIILSMD